MKLRQQVQHYEMLVKRYAPPQFEASGGVPIASCAQEMVSGLGHCVLILMTSQALKGGM